MYLCLRIDLEYLPWENCPAGELPHSESAMFIRLLDVVRKLGPRLHFFATVPVMRAFPAMVSALLQEGHDLDWLCLDPTSADISFELARQQIGSSEYEIRGMGTKEAWPSELELPSNASFLSSRAGPLPSRIRHFPVTIMIDGDRVKSAQTMTTLNEDLRALLRDHASRRVPATFAIQLPALATVDRQLMSLHRLIEFAESIDMPIRTLRQVEGESGTFRRIVENS